MEMCDFNSIFLQEKMLECLADIKKMRTFATAIERESDERKT